MNAVINRQKIRKNLPHGSIKLIAEKADVHHVNVSKWMAGLFDSVRIEQAVLEIYHKQMKSKMRRLSKYQGTNKLRTART